MLKAAKFVTSSLVEQRRCVLGRRIFIEEGGSILLEEGCLFRGVYYYILLEENAHFLVNFVLENS